MDLSKFDTTKAANTGKFLHLSFSGKKLYFCDANGEDIKDRPIGFQVKGVASNEFKGRTAALRKERVARAQVTRSGKIKGLEGVEDEQRELYASCVTGFVNFKLDGKEMDTISPTAPIVVAILDRFPAWEDQLVDFVTDEANWLGEN